MILFQVLYKILPKPSKKNILSIQFTMRSSKLATLDLSMEKVKVTPIDIDVVNFLSRFGNFISIYPMPNSFMSNQVPEEFALEKNAATSNGETVKREFIDHLYRTTARYFNLLSMGWRVDKGVNDNLIYLRDLLDFPNPHLDLRRMYAIHVLPNRWLWEKGPVLGIGKGAGGVICVICIGGSQQR